MTNNYNTARIRQFLLERFHDEELEALCFDYFPTVKQDFTEGMTKRRKINLLLEHCLRQNRFSDLLAALQRERPRVYAEFFPQKTDIGFQETRMARPSRRDPRQVFICHSGQDAEFAHKLGEELQQNGWPVWIAPESVHPGEKWVEAINRGLEESGKFILILTPNALRSRWVELETDLAIQLERSSYIQFFSLLVEPCEPPLLWKAFQWIDFHQHYADGFSLLMSALNVPYNEIISERLIEQEKSSARMIWSVDKKEMVYIPTGKFIYGEGKEAIDLAAFWIDKTPVTNKEYAYFINMTGHKPPKYWRGENPPEGSDDHPVVYVSWQDAAAYAKWTGKRLPSQEEWEKAARGVDGRDYPWGNWAEGRCNSEEEKSYGTTPAGQYSPAGDSMFGCQDMSGNVWEWTSSWTDNRRKYRVIRGGSWDDGRFDVKCVANSYQAPYRSNSLTGFRLVTDDTPE